MTVSDGVRVGVGMFIKLPLILLGIIVGVFVLLIILSALGRMLGGSAQRAQESQTPTTHTPTKFEWGYRCPKGQRQVMGQYFPHCESLARAKAVEAWRKEQGLPLR